MGTNEEILDIILAIQAQGLAEADAVNKVIAQTGAGAVGSAGQINVLTKAHDDHAASITRVASAERQATYDANTAARAFGALGDSGAAAFERVSALGNLATGGPGGLGMIAGLVAGGAIIEGGKSMIENADKNETAQRNLSQAFASQGKSLQVHQGEIDSFLSKNASFISSEYEAKDSIATIVRAGNDWTGTQRLMNDALDLSAAKHISLTDATKVLVDAESGRTMGLLDLGIALKNIEDPYKEIAKSTKVVQTATEQHTHAEQELRKWEDAHHDRSRLTQSDLDEEAMLKDKVGVATNKLTTAEGDLATALKLARDSGSQYNQVLDQVEGKVPKARDDTSDLEQANHRLGKSWDDLSNKYGPALETELSHVIDYINDHGIPAVEQLAAGLNLIAPEIGKGGLPGTEAGEQARRAIYDATHGRQLQSNYGQAPTGGDATHLPAGWTVGPNGLPVYGGTDPNAKQQLDLNAAQLAELKKITENTQRKEAIRLSFNVNVGAASGGAGANPVVGLTSY